MFSKHQFESHLVIDQARLLKEPHHSLMSRGGSTFASLRHIRGDGLLARYYQRRLMRKWANLCIVSVAIRIAGRCFLNLARVGERFGVQVKQVSMSDLFDPYHKWLGIARKDQPPHHYRLLGVEPFEEDLQVIEGAADRQAGYLRRYQSGEHAAECQKLLNEVARARLCLLKPQSKAAYDRSLRQQLDASAEFSDADFDDSEAADPDVAQGTHRSLNQTGRGGWPDSWVIPAVIGGVLLVVVAGGWLVMQGGGDRPPAPVVPIAKSQPEQPQVADLAKIPEQPAKLPVTEPQDVAFPQGMQLANKAAVKVAATAPSSVVERGQTVNVLPLLKPDDVGAGNWQIEPNRLVVDGMQQDAQIGLPVDVPSEYTVHVQGVRQPTPGSALNTIGVILPLGEQRALYAVDVSAVEGISGLQFVDGRDWSQNETTVSGFLTEPGKPFELDVIVHRDGIEARVGGRTVMDWQGDLNRLTLSDDWNKAPSNRPALVSAAKCEFSQLTVGPPLPRKPLPGTDLQPGQSVELLPLVDLQQDVWAGKPARIGNLVRTDTSFFCKFTVPFAVPKEYSLVVEFETELPAKEFMIGFPFQAGQGTTTFGNNMGESNYLFVDRAWTQFVPEHFVRRRFIHEPRTKLEYLVRHNHVQVKNGDDTIFDWRGDPRRFMADPGWTTPGNRIAIGTHEVVYTFHSIKLTRLAETKPPFESPRVPQDGDLLALVDAARDTVLGVWQVQAGQLTSTAHIENAIRFPARLPANFEFRLVVERKTGDDLVEVTIPVKGVPVIVAIDGYRGTAGGIEFRDGLRYDHNKLLFKYEGHRLPLGEMAVIQGRVKDRRLTLEINGNKYLDLDVPHAQSGTPEVLRPGWLTPEERLQLTLWTGSSLTVWESRFRPLVGESPKFPKLDLVALKSRVSTNSGKPDTKPPPAVPAAPGRTDRRAVPTDAERDAALAQLQERYSKEFAAARSVFTAYQSLCTQLEKLASTDGGDGATKYAALLLARDLYVRWETVKSAVTVADVICAEFAVDRLEFKSDLSKELATKVKGQRESKETLDATLPLIEEAIDVEQYELASELATLCIPLAVRVKDLAIRGEIGDLKKTAEACEKERTAANAAREALAQNRNDGDSRLKLGRWLCLRKGQWEEGLPHLAESSDSKLKNLAVRDLRSSTHPSGMIQAGISWMMYAKNEKGSAATEFAGRGLYWLQKALPIATGSEKTRVEQLMENCLEIRDKNLPIVNHNVLLDVVEQRADRGSFERSKETPQRHGQPFESLSQPTGILVGVNFAIGEYEGQPVVQALQPIYITRRGPVKGPWHGASNVQGNRIVEVRARQGYAINGFYSQTGGVLDNTQVSFARVSRGGLNARQTYLSPVYGLPRKPEPDPLYSITTPNQPIIGLFGHTDNWLGGLGVIAIKQ